MKRYACLLLALAWGWTALAGCTNVKQLNRISFVTAIGIDKTGTGLMVHALVAVPGNYTALSPGGGGGGAGGGGGKSSPDYVLSEEGSEVAEALYKMKRKSSRDLNFGHTRIILIADELARGDVSPLLDLFMRRAEFQINAWIAVTKGSPKKVLQAVTDVPQSVSDYLVDLFSQTGSDTMETLPVYLYQFYSYLREPGKTPYAMRVDTEKKGNQPVMTDLVLFREGKMAGTLAPKETKYLQMLIGKRLKAASILVKDRSFVVLRYRAAKKVTDDGIKVDIRVHVEIDEKPSDSPTPIPELRKLELEIADTLQEDMRELIQKMQKLKADPVGFGEKYRLAHGGHLDADEWTDSIFPELPVRVKVTAVIERTGMLK